MAEMTAAHAIERAEHAIRTGQPNLACIYMRRATVLVAQDHTAARRRIRQARIRNAGNAVELLALAFEDIATAIADALDPIVQACATVTNPRNAYALAGPSKGGPR